MHATRARSSPDRRALTSPLPPPPLVALSVQMECLHTFCHECIVKVVQPGKASNACPKCGIALGNNPFVEKKIVRDGTKTGIVDKLRKAGVVADAAGEAGEEAEAAAAAE